VPRLIRVALERAKVKGGSSGVDVIGDIAIVRLTGLPASEKRRVGKSLLLEMKNVEVVMEQKGSIQGEYRLRKLTHLAGDERTTTVHRENGCSFKVDVARCYFSPRLSTERLRVSMKVKKRERVLNMFAGVGPFSIEIAKKAGARVTSCEVNRLASKLHEENNRLNKVADLVTVIHGDARELPNLIDDKFDRVLMPFPAGADKFLSVALRLSRREGVIHYYRHLLGRNEQEAAKALREDLSSLLPEGTRYAARKVREVGPRWVEMVAEIRRRP
jgi:tRNA (guanine37-N1)-methyltransferase